jgi:hypothetical protein
LKFSKRQHALDQRDLGPPDLREVKLGLRGIASALEDDHIRGIAGDLACQSFNAFGAFCA